MPAAFAEPQGLAAAEKALEEFAQNLRPGARAVLHGLSKRPDIVGSIVEVIRHEPQTGRWVCQMQCGGTVNVAPHNLAPAPGEAALPARAGLNRVPYRIEANAQRKVPHALRRGGGGGRQRSSACEDGKPRWRCPLVQQLTSDNTSTMGRVVGRWAQKAEDFATDHVRNAFEGLWSQLRNAGAPGDVTAALALAGSDVADHEATMQQAEELVRAGHVDPCVARVGPDDFRSLPLAVRRICFQFTRCGGRGGDAYPEDEEDEDSDPSRSGALAGGAVDFVDWYRERGATGHVVLLISQADAVPKDALRDVLSCWGAACGDGDIPLLVVLGLQHPPQGRFELLESEPLGTLRMAGAGVLFDARAVCNQLLEHIISDPNCPLALAPQLLHKLRDLFLYTRHSVSYVMKTLALLCEAFLSENRLATVLCAPMSEHYVGARPSKEALEQHFQVRLLRAPELAESLRQLRPPADRECSSDDLLDWAAQAAAAAVLWRRTVVESFSAWDALLCFAQPMARHEVRLRRLCKLLQALWPQADAKAGVGSPADEEKRVMTGLLGSCLRALDPQLTRREHVDKLLQSLLSTGTQLEASLKDQLEAMNSAEVKDDALCNGLRGWYYQLCKAAWQPLEHAPRQLFLEGFCCSQHLVRKVEQRLAGTGALCSEAILLPLARGCADEAAGAFPADAALLFRLLESSQGRAVAVADLWESFGVHARPGGEPEALKKRFGQALLSLHVMGLFTPRQGTRAQADGAPPVSGWKLVKRRFGRIATSPAEAAKSFAMPEVQVESAPETAPPEPTGGGGSLSERVRTPFRAVGAVAGAAASKLLARKPSTPAGTPERKRMHHMISPVKPVTPWRGAARPEKEVRAPGAKRVRVFM